MCVCVFISTCPHASSVNLQAHSKYAHKFNWAWPHARDTHLNHGHDHDHFGSQVSSSVLAWRQRDGRAAAAAARLDSTRERQAHKNMDSKLELNRTRRLASGMRQTSAHTQTHT